MKYLFQIGIIILFTFLGEVLSQVIPLAVPAAIWGLLLLFLALCLGVVKVEAVRESAGLLVAILPALFVAPTVNLMDETEALLGKLPAVIIIVVVSLLVTMFVGGWVTQLLRKNRKGE